MKTTPLCLLLLVTSLAASGRAESVSRAQIIQERDRVLSQILAIKEGLNRNSAATPDEMAAAQIALYSFRRDVAATTEEKIKNQELIVQVRTKKLEFIKGKRKAGLATDLDILEATAPFLEAQQLLAELQLTLTTKKL
jgi:hypothetical protein